MKQPALNHSAMPAGRPLVMRAVDGSRARWRRASPLRALLRNSSRGSLCETTWPEAGSQLFHAVGAWTVIRSDVTVEERLVPGQVMVLEALGRPLRVARVTLAVEPPS